MPPIGGAGSLPCNGNIGAKKVASRVGFAVGWWGIFLKRMSKHLSKCPSFLEKGYNMLVFLVKDNLPSPA
jgi:hypothetical protein